LKISIAQLNFIIGDFDGNLAKILNAVAQAKSEKADIICFSELCVVGYPARDFLEFEDFIKSSDKVVKKLAKAAKGIAIVVGAPTVNPVLDGKDLYNSAYFLADGKIQQIQHKTLLPTYDIFDEYRYFEPASEWNIVEYKGKRIALSVCEDIWNLGNENPLYTVCPIDKMMPQKPDFILNLSASPFSYAQAEERIRIVKTNVKRYKVPMFYVNHVGAQTEIIFDGGSLVVSPNGKVYEELPYFEECVKTYDLDAVMNNKKQHVQAKDKMTLIHDSLVVGVKNYFGKLGFKKAILGLSGGIDSAVTAVIAARALGPENVRFILMPSQYSSDHSVNDARTLAQNLGCQYDIIQIEDIYDSYMKKLEPHFFGYPFNITEENIQARIRGMLGCDRRCLQNRSF